jgi:hypothetical protein
MARVERLLIFLASPGDVLKERRYVQEVVEDLNRTVAPARGVVLQVINWEDDAFPGYGADAQALINSQIAEMGKYALFVGIMWNRLGTPTPRSASGTVEEFERAASALEQHGQPAIWFYFRQSPGKMDTEEQLEQRRKVLEFKKRVEAKGLPWSYKRPADFEDKFRNQVMLWLISLNLETPAIEKTQGRESLPADSISADFLRSPWLGIEFWQSETRNALINAGSDVIRVPMQSKSFEIRLPKVPPNGSVMICASYDSVVFSQIAHEMVREDVPFFRGGTGMADTSFGSGALWVDPEAHMHLDWHGRLFPRPEGGDAVLFNSVYAIHDGEQPGMPNGKEVFVVIHIADPDETKILNSNSERFILAF